MALDDRDREIPAPAGDAAGESFDVPAQRVPVEREPDRASRMEVESRADRDGDDGMAKSVRTPMDQRRVPVHWFAGRVHEVIDDLVDPVVAVADLDVAAVAETVAELRAAMHRLNALEAVVLTWGQILDVAATQGATSTAAWLAHTTTSTQGEARRAVKLAAALIDTSRPGSSWSQVASTPTRPRWSSRPSTRYPPGCRPRTESVPRSTC